MQFHIFPTRLRVVYGLLVFYVRFAEVSTVFSGQLSLAVRLLTSIVDDDESRQQQEEMLQFHLGLHFDGLAGKRYLLYDSCDTRTKRIDCNYEQ